MELEDSFQNQLSEVVAALPQGQEVKVHDTCWDHQDYFLEYLLENDSKGKGGFEKLSICVGEEELGHELTFETEDDSMKLNMLWDLEDSENWVSEVDCTLPQVSKLKKPDTYKNHMLDSGSKLKGPNTCVDQGKAPLFINWVPNGKQRKKDSVNEFNTCSDHPELLNIANSSFTGKELVEMESCAFNTELHIAAPTSSSRGKKEHPCSQKGHWFDTSIPGERKCHQKCESAHKSKRMVKYEKDRGYCTGVR
jgi:hypothetical protein